MLSPRTARQLSNAIGSAKELTEATLRASLDRLGQTYTKSDDLGTLMRKWRVAVADKASPMRAARMLSIRRCRHWGTSFDFSVNGAIRTGVDTGGPNTRPA
jgi:hypothetical protein